MSDITLNPKVFVTDGGVVSSTNPLPISSEGSVGTANALALDPFVPVVEGAIVSTANPLPVTLGPAPNPDAVSWMAAVVAAGGTVSAEQLERVTILIDALDNAGVWDLAVDIGLRAAENSTQAYISLKLHQTITPHNSPYFTAYWGTGYDGVSMYDDWGIKPADYPLLITPTSMEISIREVTNTNATTTSMGCLNGNNNLIITSRGGGGNAIAQLVSSSISGPTNPSSARVVSALRDGTTYTFRAAGADLGTGTPTTSGSAFPDITITWAARHLTASVDGYRRCVIAAGGVFAPLTLTQESAWNNAIEAYISSINVNAATTYYVSSVNFGGIPIGADGNAGTIGAPFLTLGRGLFTLPPGGTVLLNGNPASPAVYTQSPSPTFDVSATLEAVNALGATVAGAGVVQCFAFAPSTEGTTLLFDGVTADAGSNVGGPAGRVVAFNVVSVTGRLQFNGAVVTGWTGASAAAVYGNGASFMGYIDVTDSTFSGDDVGSCIVAMNAIAGGFTSSGSTYTILQQNALIVGAVNWGATVSGTTFSSIDDTINVTIRADIVDGSYHYGLQAINVDNAIISNLVVNFDCAGTPVTAQGCSLHYSPDSDTGTASCSNGLVEDVTVTFANANVNVGGILVGAEASLVPSKSVGNIIRRGTVVGTGVGHGIYLGYQLSGQMLDSICNDVDLNFLLKGGLNNLMENCTGSNATSAVILVKGEASSTVRGNTATQHAGSTGDLLRIEDNDTISPVVHSTGIVVSGNTFVANNTTAGIVLRASNTATFSGNVYNVVAGGTITFSYQGSTLTPAQWKATIEPSATGNIF